MEEKVKQAYLYDFYGELLNERQRHIFEDFVLNDLSLSEIAGEEGISRQGVYDMVKRCVRTLEDYEEKLHLLEKFLQIKGQVLKIRSLTRAFSEEKEQMLSEQKDRTVFGKPDRMFLIGKDREFSDEIDRLASEILEEL
ncbi:MAG: YlxM family DNA-binding protein [Eubacterium sp.]|jgi:Uncharacterized protein conserved in bacteria|nr:YlxM family DNA-binding protein [Eubacterium sp.]